MEDCTIDIIIPVYHPGSFQWQDRIVECIHAYIDQAGLRQKLNLWIVNDGEGFLDFPSHRFSPSVNCEVIDYPGNRGKGFAIKAGLQRVKGDFIIYTDHDIPYGIGGLFTVTQRLMEGAQVILPLRDSSYYQQLPLKRRWISKGLIWTNQKLLGLQHPDTQGGLKGIRKEVAPLIREVKENGFLFEVEWIREAEKKNYRIDTASVELTSGAIPSSVSNLRILKLIYAYLRLLFS